MNSLETQGAHPAGRGVPARQWSISLAGIYRSLVRVGRATCGHVLTVYGEESLVGAYAAQRRDGLTQDDSHGSVKLCASWRLYLFRVLLRLYLFQYYIVFPLGGYTSLECC